MNDDSDGLRRVRITARMRLCEQPRSEAFDIMIQHAAESGAIAGARYDATEIAGGATEALAYGTAVVVEPVEAGGIYDA